MKQSIQLYFAVDNRIIPKGNNVIEGIHNLFHIDSHYIHDNTAIYVHLAGSIDKKELESTLVSFCEHIKNSDCVIEAKLQTMPMPSQGGIIPFSFDNSNKLCSGRYTIEIVTLQYIK